MNLYLLRARRDLHKGDDPWKPWYDKAFGFVVRAEDETQARAFAQAKSGDETSPDYGSKPLPAWTDEGYSTCVVLGTDGDPGVILRDFAAA